MPRGWRPRGKLACLRSMLPAVRCALRAVSRRALRAVRRGWERSPAPRCAVYAQPPCPQSRRCALLMWTAGKAGAGVAHIPAPPSPCKTNYQNTPQMASGWAGAGAGWAVAWCSCGARGARLVPPKPDAGGRGAREALAHLSLAVRQDGLGCASNEYAVGRVGRSSVWTALLVRAAAA